MKNYSLSLFIEINNSEFTFVVGDKDEKNNFKIETNSIDNKHKYYKHNKLIIQNYFK